MVSVHAHVLVMQNLQCNIKKDDFYLDTSKSNQNDFFSSVVFITQPLTYLHYTCVQYRIQITFIQICTKLNKIHLYYCVPVDKTTVS